MDKGEEKNRYKNGKVRTRKGSIQTVKEFAYRPKREQTSVIPLFIHYWEREELFVFPDSEALYSY